MATKSSFQLRDPSLWREYALIDDEWTSLHDHETFDVIDPANETAIASYPDMTVEDTRRAINAAYTAFRTFSKTTPQFRADLLLKFHQLVIDNLEDLGRLITLENGKSIGDARAEVSYGASYLQWNSGEALRMYGRTIPSSLPGTRNWTQLEPIGVVAALCPWNFPVGMICRKIGPVLAVGATVVIKVPAETPLSVMALIELARRAGLPKGVIQVITTDRHLVEIGKELCTNPKIKKISFTGSTRVGKVLMSQSAGSLKKLSMELGGNAAFIVFEDADLDLAVNAAIASKFRGSGQTCVCANRIYVHEHIHDEFARRMGEAVDKMVVGDGFDEKTQVPIRRKSALGPLIHPRAVEKCASHVADAVKRGARIVTKAPLKRTKGYYFDPVVLANAPNDCLIADEETFGPVACLIRFKSEEEVIEMANDSDVGLAGYFCTRDSDRIFRVADALQTGMVGVNTGSISQAVIPFGGAKESGFGKEGGSEAILDFCVVKTVIVANA